MIYVYLQSKSNYWNYVSRKIEKEQFYTIAIDKLLGHSASKRIIDFDGIFEVFDMQY